MKLLRTILILNTILFFQATFGQNIYPNKMEGCNTQHFALEGDSISAKKNPKELIRLLTKHIKPIQLVKAKGVLKVQIIAYEDGSSCLMSYENKTNLKTADLNMAATKETIDTELVWDAVPKNVSPMIELYFDHGAITLRRMGINGKKGLHELSE